MGRRKRSSTQSARALATAFIFVACASPVTPKSEVRRSSRVAPTASEAPIQPAPRDSTESDSIADDPRAMPPMDAGNWERSPFWLTAKDSPARPFDLPMPACLKKVGCPYKPAVLPTCSPGLAAIPLTYPPLGGVPSLTGVLPASVMGVASASASASCASAPASLDGAPPQDPGMAVIHWRTSSTPSA